MIGAQAASQLSAAGIGRSALYTSPSGNVYARESHRWDILY